MNLRIKRSKNFVHLLFFAAGVVLFCCTVFFVGRDAGLIKNATKYKAPATAQMSREELLTHFELLAEEGGALAAFEVLQTASLPVDTDAHIVAHVIGDVLYAEKGAEGMKYCTHDFHNACSHAIAANFFLEEGIDSLQRMRTVCGDAGEDMVSFFHCFHGLGHGILTYSSYNFEQAVELCETVGSEQHLHREAAECVGGATMELVFGGSHDRKTWEEQKAVYMKGLEDPFSPCNAPFLSDSSRPFCYVYLTPHIFEILGTDRENPDPAYFKQALGLCESIPAHEEENKRVCYGGFGKDFIWFVLPSGDTRSMGEEIKEEHVSTLEEWCSLAPTFSGASFCLEYALDSLYWGGQEEVDAPLRFCSSLSNTYKDACFTALIDRVLYYEEEEDKRLAFCKVIPDVYFESCQARAGAQQR